MSDASHQRVFIGGYCYRCGNSYVVPDRGDQVSYCSRACKEGMKKRRQHAHKCPAICPACQRGMATGQVVCSRCVAVATRACLSKRARARRHVRDGVRHYKCPLCDWLHHTSREPMPGEGNRRLLLNMRPYLQVLRKMAARRTKENRPTDTPRSDECRNTSATTTSAAGSPTTSRPPMQSATPTSRSALDTASSPSR